MREEGVMERVREGTNKEGSGEGDRKEREETREGM